MSSAGDEVARCRSCGFEADGGDFDAGGMYSDLRCPKCGTTNVDTSRINAAWAARGEKYGYGDDNALDTSGWA